MIKLTCMLMENIFFKCFFKLSAYYTQIFFKAKFSVFHSKKISIPFSISFHESIMYSPGKQMSIPLLRKIMKLFWPKMKFLNFWCKFQGKGHLWIQQTLPWRAKQPLCLLQHSSFNLPTQSFPELNCSLKSKWSSSSVLKVNIFWFCWKLFSTASLRRCPLRAAEAQGWNFRCSWNMLWPMCSAHGSSRDALGLWNHFSLIPAKLLWGCKV